MADIHLEHSPTEHNECNICYEQCCEGNSLVNLSCCKNSKQICIKCISCLTTPICPYCRNKLDEQCFPFLQIDTNVSHSDPQAGSNYFDNIYNNDYSFQNFIAQERIINPFIYENSRRLRRQIRRLRHEYNQRHSSNNSNIIINRNRNRNRNNSSRYHNNQNRRNQRHSLNSQTRNVTNLYNQLNSLPHGISYELYDEELLFNIEVEY